MAKEDNYKEGVDFEYVQGNGDDSSNFKTRRFFTRAEKAARAAGKTAPKAAAPAPKAKPKAAAPAPAKPKYTSTKVGARPEGGAAGMPEGSNHNAIRRYTAALDSGDLTASEGRTARTLINRLGGTYNTDALRAQAADQTARSTANQGMKELMTGRQGAAAQYKKGGAVKEGSAKDTRQDKVKAKKAGMSMTKWEGSAADKKHDAPSKMRKGGVVKKATGGSMRGTGAAVRGKGFSGCY